MFDPYPHRFNLRSNRVTTLACVYNFMTWSPVPRGQRILNFQGWMGQHNGWILQMDGRLFYDQIVGMDSEGIKLEYFMDH